MKRPRTDLTPWPHFQRLVETSTYFRKLWEQGHFPPVDIVPLTPEEAAARTAQAKVRRDQTIAALRKRYRLTYAGSPLFEYCLTQCPKFLPTTTACNEPAKSCADRHRTWVGRVSAGNCPHYTQTGGEQA